MGATTFPQASTAATVDDVGVGLAFLAIAAVDAVLIGLLTLAWILHPTSAPLSLVVMTTPLMALATMTLATSIRRRMGAGRRRADLLASTARWWSLFGLLLSLPATLIVTTL